MVIAKKFVLADNHGAIPKEGDMNIVEEKLPEIQNGEFLVEALYISVDPYQLAVFHGVSMFGGQVGKVIESKNPKFPVGKYVLGNWGWRSHTISDGTDPVSPPTALSDPRGAFPLSAYLGIFGLTGHTAYFGLFDILKPKAKEVLVVSGAAGAVGSTVGQLAKAKGCTVIGIAGSEEKGKWLVNELGFDSFINYKTQNVEEALKEKAPEGVDIYFDNIGGEMSCSVIKNMKRFGRVALCGSSSAYGEKEPKVSQVQPILVMREIKMEGFTMYRYGDRKAEATKHNIDLFKNGKLKNRETITEGFENIFKAFLDMLKGGNTGKAIIKV